MKEVLNNQFSKKISDINLFKSYPNIITKVRFVLGDIIEIQKYKHMLQKCHTVIHTASPFVNKKFDNNFNMTMLNMLENDKDRSHPMFWAPFVLVGQNNNFSYN